MNKIFSGAAAVVHSVEDGPVSPTAASHPSAPQPAASPASPSVPDTLSPKSVAASAATPQNVDVEAVLTSMATEKGGGGNWQSSIVDLLKLLDLDSSLGARKQLANELDVHVAADGSAEENSGLHKAVMQKLADNGGKVPESLKN